MLCKYATLFWYLCITLLWIFIYIHICTIQRFNVDCKYIYVKHGVFLYLLYEYTSCKGPFNNYMHQILINFDLFPTPLGWTSLDFWMAKFLKLGSQCSATAIATAVIRQLFCDLDTYIAQWDFHIGQPKTK